MSFLLSALLVCTFLVTAGAQSRGRKCAKMDDIRIMIFASLFNNMVTYIAQDAGFLKNNCLAATLVPVNTGPAGMAQLQSGSLQFSDSSFDNTLIARTRGLPIKVVVGESSGAIYSIVARKNLTLAHETEGYPGVMKDLVGKKVGVFGRGTGSEYFVRALLSGAGADPESVTYVAVGSTPTQLASLQNGAVDAVIMGDPAQDLAVHGGFGKIIVDLRKAGVGPKTIQDLNGTFQVKVASESFIKDHPDIVRRYVAANEEASRWIRNPANLAKLTEYMKARVSLGQEAGGLDEVFARLLKQYIAFSNVAISARSVKAWNAFELAAGNIKEPVSLDDVVWSKAPKSP